MPGTARRATFAALLLAAGCAGEAPDPSPSVVGETLHYVRTNIDGSEPEQLYMHRAAADRIEVYKMVSRCTHAALVSATIDPATGEASRLEAASLQPDGTGETYGTLTFDGTQLAADVTLDGEAYHVSTRVGERPWHLYDYDLATLAAGTMAKPPKDDFGFGLALVWVDPDNPGDMLHWLGSARATLAGEEPHEGYATHRFDVGGEAFGPAGGGPLWIDAATGRIVDVQWQRPNHEGYSTFRLRLVGEEPRGEDAWRALLRRHYAGCPG